MIDTSYFIDAINLPSAILKRTANMATYINRYSKQYLVSALGFDLYTAYIAGIAEITPAQKWLDIRDGKNYEVDGIKKEWIGLENDTKQSFLAQFIFCEIVQQNMNSLSSNGFWSAKNENSNRVQATGLVASEYNQAIEWYNQLYYFITEANNEAADTYPNFEFTELTTLSALGI